MKGNLVVSRRKRNKGSKLGNRQLKGSINKMKNHRADNKLLLKVDEQLMHSIVLPAVFNCVIDFFFVIPPT